MPLATSSDIAPASPPVCESAGFAGEPGVGVGFGVGFGSGVGSGVGFGGTTAGVTSIVTLFESSPSVAVMRCGLAVGKVTE